MEAHTRAAFRKQRIVLRKWIALAGQIARAQQRHDSSDISSDRERGKVPVQFDVIVELFRYSGWLRDFRDGTRRFSSQLKPPFDLTNLIRVLADCFLIGCSEVLFQTLQLRHQRIQNTAALPHASRSNLRSGAAAEQAFEHD